MPRKFVFFSLLALFFLVPGQAAAYDMTGDWYADFFGVVVDIDVDQLADDTIWGAAYVPNGDGSDSYHFAGAQIDGTVYAEHGSGHVFWGSVVDDETVSGTVTTSSGWEIPVSISRY